MIAAPKPNNRFNSEIAKLPLFDRDSSKVIGFVTAYNLYIRIKIREIIVKEQIQWILTNI